MAQKLETVLKAAELLYAQRDVAFLFVGDGSEKEVLVHQKEELGLDNIHFVREQPRHLIPDYLAASDVCLVPLRKAALFKKNVPSKIYEIMACARPILIGAVGEALSLVQEANAGVGYPPEDHTGLSQQIMCFYSDRERLNTCGMSGLHFVKTFYSRDRFAARYLSILREIVPR